MPLAWPHWRRRKHFLPPGPGHSSPRFRASPQYCPPDFFFLHREISICGPICLLLLDFKNSVRGRESDQRGMLHMDYIGVHELLMRTNMFAVARLQKKTSKRSDLKKKIARLKKNQFVKLLLRHANINRVGLIRDVVSCPCTNARVRACVRPCTCARTHACMHARSSAHTHTNAQMHSHITSRCCCLGFRI